MSVVISKDNVAKVIAAVEAMTRRSVYIGIVAEKNDRGDGEPIGNALIGLIQERGTDRIPPRPHLASGVQEAAPQATEYMRQGGQKALEGKLAAVDASLNMAGMVCRDSVKMKITAGLEPPLADRTLAARRSRGYAGEKPLIAFTPGVDLHYIQAISYVVRSSK